MYKECNPNPDRRLVGDCVVRALAVALERSWECIYTDLAVEGLKLHDMPNANWVWGTYLHEHGYEKYLIPDTCPDCYTVKRFCTDHPIGVFILSTESHVVTVIDGDYYDAWDSGNEIPVYFWRKK